MVYSSLGADDAAVAALNQQRFSAISSHATKGMEFPKTARWVKPSGWWLLPR